MKRSPDQTFEAAVIGGNFAGLQAALYLPREPQPVVLFQTGPPPHPLSDQSPRLSGAHPAGPVDTGDWR